MFYLNLEISNMKKQNVNSNKSDLLVSEMSNNVFGTLTDWHKNV